MVTEKGKTLEQVKQNGQAEKTQAQKCMDEIQDVLNKYNCEPLCVQQRSFGQPVWIWAVNEIKK